MRSKKRKQTSAAVFSESENSFESRSIACGTVAMLTRRSPSKVTVNEDACAVIPLEGLRCVFVVADGCGGMAKGELAAKIAVDTIRKSSIRALPHEALAPFILDGIDSANATILEQEIGAATTLAVAEYDAGSVRTYHVGDSQVLLIGGRGKIKLVTAAHSPIGFAEQAGMLSEEEAMNHDDRHLVSNVVGCEDMTIEIGPIRRLADRDTLLLSTDGLFDNLTLDQISKIVNQPTVDEVSRVIESRVVAAMDIPETGKPDDLAIVVFRPNHKIA